MEIQTIRDLLRQGETGKALEALIDLLEKDSRFKDNLLRTLRVTEANYNAVRQQELKGILPFQEAQREYSRVADTLLAVLQDVEAGRVPAAAVSSRRRYLLWAGALLLLVLALVFWKLRAPAAGCPEYTKAGALHILILPFDNLGELPTRPEAVIQDSIKNLTRKAKIPAEVKPGAPEGKSGANSQNAGDFGTVCKADLVIYGQYQAFTGESIRVRMGFQFIGGNAQSGTTPFQLYRDVTEVQPTRALEDAIFSLCTMLAIKDNNWQFARRWMAKIQEKDETDMKMAEWLDKQPKAN